MTIDETTLRDMHEKYAPNEQVLKRVYTHSVIVRDIAEQLMERYGGELDHELVRVGCMLHDIGVYQVFAKPEGQVPYIRHGVLGYEILKREGMPEEVCRFASHHIGVGLTREDIIAQKLPLPPQDYIPETTEERLVSYADMFHSKHQPPQFNSIEFLKQQFAQFGEEHVPKVEVFVETFGLPDLEVLSHKYHNIIV
ncbi:MAG: HD domain-containing protein [Candidatus Spechtbacterales bacterium]